MLTVYYKGGYIHTYFDCEWVRYQLPGDTVVKTAKSIHAAKLMITRSK